jgi:hypothetical protein
MRDWFRDCRRSVRGAGNLGLRPTFKGQIDGFVEANPGFGGKKVGALSRSELFFETSNEIGLDYDYDLGRFGTLSGRVSGVYSLTGGGLDALATNYPGSPVRDSYTIEAASFTVRPGCRSAKVRMN